MVHCYLTSCYDASCTCIVKGKTARGFSTEHYVPINLWMSFVDIFVAMSWEVFFWLCDVKPF